MCENRSIKLVKKSKLMTFIGTCTNVIKCRTVYAGFFVFFVPLVLSETDWSHKLSYSNIYNTTKYAQIQSRPYKPLNISYTRPNRNISNSFQENELEFERPKRVKPGVNSDKLLVGFSYDPYRTSVPEREYAEGVRSYSPNAIPSDGKPENRGKRGVAHLYNMIYCATGCEPLSYKGYGCYCGFLGSGKTTDGIDRCCKMHDKCYENLYCPFFTVYFQPYYWKCYHGEPLCALENHSTRNQLINGCAARLCECDRQLAMCLRRYRCPRRRAICRSSPLRYLQNVLMLK